MSGMNSWLAEIYGTNTQEDLEKTAQSHLLAKLAQEDNIDLSQFSPEELQQLLQEVLGAEGAQGAAQDVAPQAAAPVAPTAPAVHPSISQAFAAPAAQPQGFNAQVQQQVAQQAAPQQDPAALQKEAQAKFEEADLLGRVMAHAYTQELEKIAMAKTAGIKDVAKSIGGKARDAAAYAHGTARGLASKANRGHAAAAGAAAGIGIGRASKKTKEASAFEKLAEMHAADILSASGFDPATGTDMYAQQQGAETQAPEQTQVQPEVQAQGQGVDAQAQGAETSPEFAQALDQRALEMLEAAGYDVNEILARLQAGQGQA